MNNQDDHALRLLEPLREEPVGPPAFDVRRAMAAGRRRRRVRRWSVTAAAAAVTLIAAGGTVVATRGEKAAPPAPVATRRTAPPPKPLDCTMTVLPTGGIKKALVTAGDPSGRYLAGRVYPPGESVRTILWRDGKILSRDSMPGSDPDIDDLNRNGVGVGTSYVTEDRTTAFVWQDGRFTGLPGRDPSATGINDAGVIVGSAGPERKRYPVRWQPGATSPDRLPLPSGATAGRAELIDEDGTIVGTVERGERDMGSGYLWLPDGTARAMPRPDLHGRTATWFWPESIRGGKVAGRAVYEEKDSRSFAPAVYDIRTNAYESPRSGFGTPALIAGTGAVLSATGTTASIFAGAVTTNLPVTKGREYQVSSFSDDGRSAAGYSVYTDGDKVGNEPVAWRCH